MALVFAGGAYSQVSLWVFSFELAFLSFLTQVDRWSGTKKALAFSLQKKRRKQIWQKKRFTSITLPRKLSLGWNDLWSPTETYFFGGKWYISWSECLQWLRPVVLGWIDGKMDGNALVVEKFGKKSTTLWHTLWQTRKTMDNHTFQMKRHLVMVDLSCLVICIYNFDQMITKTGTTVLDLQKSKPKGRMLKNPEKSATAVLMVAQTAWRCSRGAFWATATSSAQCTAHQPRAKGEN